MNCPKCEKAVRWKLKPGRQREIGFCDCNPLGPVVDRPVSAIEPDDTETVAPVIADDEAPWLGLLTIPGVNREIARALYSRGWRTVAEVQAVSDDELIGIPGIGPLRGAKIRAWLAKTGGNE